MSVSERKATLTFATRTRKRGITLHLLIPRLRIRVMILFRRCFGFVAASDRVAVQNFK